MNFKKAGSIILLSIILIFSSCGFNDEQPKEEKIRREKRKYTVAVSSTSGDAGLSAVEKFCEKATELSNGELTLVYKISDDALNDFYNGADFLFAGNEEISRANGDFASYTSPFYFKDAKTALLTLNSQEFINSTSDVTQSLLNGKQLGCFYNGAYVFVSSKIDDLFMFSDNGEKVNMFDGLRIYGDFKYIDEYLLNLMGINTVDEVPDVSIKKFNDAQAHTVMIKKQEMDKLILPEKRELLYYYEAPYKLDFNWLFISDRVLEEMDTQYVDILREAAACALGINDSSIMDSEKLGEENIEKYPFVDMDYSVSDAFNFADTAFKNIRFKRIWDIKNHEEIRNIIS